MAAPTLNGVLETALYVESLELSVAFYQKIFEFETLFSDARLCALNVSHQQILLLFLKRASTVAMVASGGVIPPHDGDGDLHLAFSINTGELEPWKNWLRENTLAIESEVKWTRGGTSIYFRDPDKHLLELVTPGLWTIY